MRPTTPHLTPSSTRTNLAALKVSELFDSGAVHLCIPEHLPIQHNLVKLENREDDLADGHRSTLPDVGAVELRFRNPRRFNGPMVLGNEVLLGVIPMDAMDLVLRPQLQNVDVNPESPNSPLSVAKRPADPSTKPGWWCRAAEPAMLEGTVSALCHRAASSLPAESAADRI